MTTNPLASALARASAPASNAAAAALTGELARSAPSQDELFKKMLSPEDYKILTEEVFPKMDKEGELTDDKYDTFYGSLTERQKLVFDTATRLRNMRRAGRRKNRSMKKSASLHKRMTHTRKHRRRGGNKKHRTPAQQAMLEKMEKESLLEASKRIVRHAKTRKRGKKISSDKYYEYPKNGVY